MPYKYFYDDDRGPAYDRFAAFQAVNFAGTPLENYLPTWGLQAIFSMQIGLEALRRVADQGLELTAENAAEALADLQDWDTGGFFGVNVSMVDNKIGTGRVYSYSTESLLFTPTSDWFTV